MIFLDLILLRMRFGSFLFISFKVTYFKLLKTFLGERKHGFRSIAIENTVFMIGGIMDRTDGSKFNEKWTFSGEDVKQKEIFYPIDNYFGYPELFIIDKNFCSGI